jgi:heme exporter protein A
LIEIKNLIKTFLDKEIRYPDIVAKQGDFILLCGASGTGKTTLCEMIAGFLPRETGSIMINGIDTRMLNVFDSIHYLSQFPEHNLIGPTCKDDLESWQTANETQKPQNIEHLLSEYDLLDHIDTPVWKLSFGQKKALSFCALRLIKRDIWLLDEPFAGLDVDKKKTFFRQINDFLDSGGIVIITSHEGVVSDEWRVSGDDMVGTNHPLRTYVMQYRKEAHR